MDFILIYIGFQLIPLFSGVLKNVFIPIRHFFIPIRHESFSFYVEIKFYFRLFNFIFNPFVSKSFFKNRHVSHTLAITTDFLVTRYPRCETRVCFEKFDRHENLFNRHDVHNILCVGDDLKRP